MAQTTTPEAPSLCPARDTTQDEQTRVTLVENVQQAERAWQAAQAAIDDQADRCARTLTMQTMGVFRRYALDQPLTHMPEYQRWHARPQDDQKRLEALSNQCREALHTLNKARGALATHAQAVKAYERRSAFLATEAGQEMQKKYGQLYEVLEAAKELNDKGMIQSTHSAMERVEYAFIGAAHAEVRR